MNKKSKVFILIITVAFILSFSFSSLSYADNLPPVKSVPPESVVRNADPLGTIGTHTHGIIGRKGVHTENIIYTDYFDGVYGRYDGYRDRGIIEIAGPNNTSATNRSTYTISRTVSNGYSTSIGASASFVTAHVGYDVTYSTTKSWSYTVTVPPHSTVYLHYRDWYHVQEFYCHRHYWFTGSNRYGTGWSAQWYAPQFYTTEG